MRLLVVSITLLLSACGSATDYAWIFREHVTQAELDKVAAENGGYRYEKQKDYSLWMGDICRAYVLHPDLYASDNEYTYWLGHAVRHCFEGDWHEIPFDIPFRGPIPVIPR